MIALADKHGEVQGSIPGLADICRVTVAECEAAIETLSGPDRYSRSKDRDGRRIQAISGGWALVNHAKYRREASKDDEREKDAARKRRARGEETGRTRTDPDKAGRTPDTTGQTRTQPDNTGQSENVRVFEHIAEADSEADSDAEALESTTAGAAVHARPVGEAKHPTPQDQIAKAIADFAPVPLGNAEVYQIHVAADRMIQQDPVMWGGVSHTYTDAILVAIAVMRKRQTVYNGIGATLNYAKTMVEGSRNNGLPPGEWPATVKQGAKGATAPSIDLEGLKARAEAYQRAKADPNHPMHQGAKK